MYVAPPCGLHPSPLLYGSHFERLRNLQTDSLHDNGLLGPAGKRSGNRVYCSFLSRFASRDYFSRKCSLPKWQRIAYIRNSDLHTFSEATQGVRKLPGATSAGERTRQPADSMARASRPATVPGHRRACKLRSDRQVCKGRARCRCGGRPRGGSTIGCPGQWAYFGLCIAARSTEAVVAPPELLVLARVSPISEVTLHDSTRGSTPGGCYRLETAGPG